ncbi:PTS transporter subunit EIIC [Fusibacter bizertensis]|uniref:PTS transporter subunit EIIC n=1 Tax=Fusibacter bizertensis TaxID=1488331 RepID=A0ABT6NAC1_9FIRM|nr:PTS transporter subunit EIIC [Fusibacter bizertensis]MDH8677360.1 PTS transporter subunit EIIC [Fusibacter bizertensis]
MSNQELLKEIITLLGTESNIDSIANCMTRLRVKVKNPALIQKEAIQQLEGVMGVVEDDTFQIIVGPGKAQKLMDLFKASYNIPTSTVDEDWKANKEKVQSKNKKSSFKQGLRTIGEIFIPLIPAIIAAGIFNGFAGLITNLQSTGSLPASEVWNITRLVLSLMGGAFLSYFTIFTGVSAARVFGATEALGGMVGAMTVMAQINDISGLIGLYNADSPLNSILRSGKGGVIGVIVGVYILAKVEKAVRKRVPDVLDLMLTPMVTLFITAALLLVVIMPITGILSDWLVNGLELLVNSTNPVVSIISGYVLSALFLPMVLLGLHHGLIPIYAVQLEAMGGVSLFPVLAMAGAGQVGAAIAIYMKAKKVKNMRLMKVISGALPAGFLGIGEPLIYGVTLPLGKPFITAGLGAGFGGAYVMLQKVMSTAWGPSGLTAIPLMQPNSMLNYFVGLVVAYIFGFIITAMFIKDSEVANV